MTRTEALAAFFQANPNRWISALELLPIAGALSWRTRVSDVRRAPFHMDIENVQQRSERDGRVVVVGSFYRFRSEPARGEERRVSSEEPRHSPLLF